jgi:4-hydroxyphenylpyruvate dioxygenase
MPVRVKGGVDPESALLDHHREHGDGSSTSRSEVPDVDRCIEHARAQGARVIEEPHDLTDEHGTVRLAAIAAYGQTRHTLVQRTGYTGVYLPGYQPRTSTYTKRDGAPKRLFQALDHVVGNVELGQMDTWVAFYNRVMGFVNMAEFIGDDIATDYSALMSKVVANGNHRVKFPLNEPAGGQAQEPDRRVPRVLPRPRCAAPGAGHQRHPHHGRHHAAEGVEFLDTPDSYYSDPELRARIGEVRVPVEELQKRGSWSTGTRTATCCRSSPSRSATGRPCSSS